MATAGAQRARTAAFLKLVRAIDILTELKKKIEERGVVKKKFGIENEKRT